MVGDLPRTSRAGSAAAGRLLLRWAALGAAGSIVLLAGGLRAADDPPEGAGGVPAAAATVLRETRRITGCAEVPTDDSGREFVYRGRPAIEIKGRARGGDAPGALRDLAVFDPASGSIVSSICFGNASTRKHGESIVSLAEISGRADRLARALLPDGKLELESVLRAGAGGVEHIYYEARYASASGEIPFLEPPVRLLLNASTTTLFRFEIDPDWINPLEPPRVRISRKAAERIAAVVLKGHDFTPTFGPGAAFGSLAPAELFTVHPNDRLGFSPESREARARVAWVVPFRLAGAAGVGLHGIFIDAATGLVLGGLVGQSAGLPPR